MDLKSDYYSYLDVKGKSADAIFRELCTNDAYRQIENGTWKETLINRFGEMLAALPDVRTTANRVLRDGMRKKGQDIDPENLYFNIFSSYVVPANPADTNYYHTGNMLKESYRLTDAALMNVFKLHYEGSYYLLKTWRTTGIYKVGKEGSVDRNKPDYKSCWGPHNAAFQAYDPAEIIANTSLDAEYTKDYNAYWTRYSDLYRDMLADFFLAGAINQYKAGLLSEYGFAMVRKVYAKQTDVSAYWLDINTYKATDIILMESQVSGMTHTILYIPGSSTPFVEFDNVRQMKTWIVRKLANPAAMGAFLKHFSLFNRMDGVSYTGVDNIIKKMAAGDTSWDPQRYILASTEKIPGGAVFEKVRDHTKAVMYDNAQRQITTNSEYYRDYALGLVETLLSYTVLLDMIVPQVGIPLNIVLSLTALGLSSDIVINGDTLEKRMNGLGSLVNSAIYFAINLLPIFKEAGGILKLFRRAAADIPAFAEEEQFIMNTFHLDSKAALDRIQPGDSPHVFEHATGELRLVRLADGGKPLVVLRRVSGNKFARLNPMTFEELEGEKFISEVLSDSSSGKPVYLSGSSLRGGAPYNPQENFFEDVWTPEELKKAADKLGKEDAKYANIKKKLDEMHKAPDFEAKQLAAHELLYQLKDYEKAYPKTLRTPVLNVMGSQIKEALYPFEARILCSRLVDSEAGMHPLVASRIYTVSQAERLGEVAHDVTFGLIKYAQEDPVLSITALSEEAQMAAPADIDFPVKYAIRDMSVVNKLDEDFTRIPEYASQGLTHHEDIFRYALNKSQAAGLLTKWRITRSGVRNVSFIGYSYEELLATINEYSSSATTRFGIHPNTVARMIKGLLKGGGEGEMMRQFGRRDYFEATVRERLGSMERNIHLFDSTALDSFDLSVQTAFDPAFDQLTSETEKLSKLMENPNGFVINNGADEISYCLRNIDFFKNNGVTHIGVTDFFADLHQPAIDKFLEGGFLSPVLEATMLTADKGVTEGPLFQLMTALRSKKLKVTALGYSNTTLYSRDNAFGNAYTKGIVARNAGRLLKGKKAIVLADIKTINTTPGLTVPSLGISQVLEAPGIYYNTTERTMHYLPDAPTNRASIFLAKDRDWRTLSPTKGRFLGWKKYGDNFTYVTPRQREASVFSKITTDLEGFKREFNEIRDLASLCQSARQGVCDAVGRDIRDVLSQANKRVGPGRSLCWWRRDGASFAKERHTAISVYIRDTEYIVDGAHLQFPHDLADEGVMILPADDWAEEILNRVKAYNPYMADRFMTSGSLFTFDIPDFTRPRMPKKRS